MAKPNAVCSPSLSPSRRRSTRLNLHRRCQASDQAYAVGYVLNLYSNGHPLGQAHPREDRVDLGKTELVGLRVWDVDTAGDANDLAANNFAISHQLDLRKIAVTDGRKLRFLEIGIDPIGICINNGNYVLSNVGIISLLCQEIGYPSAHRRADLCALKIHFRPIQLGNSLPMLRMGCQCDRFVALPIFDRFG